MKNEAGCVSGPASITLASQPQSPAVPTLGKVDPTCALATGCVTITSSTAGLTFSLDGGEYASYPSGGWCGLAAGSTHSVTVKNEAGCVSGPASITLASQPQSPAVPTLGKVDPTCALATGCVTITSSTAGLTFSLDGGEYASYPSGGWCGLAAGSTHSVTVKNEAGCVSGPASITLASQPQSPAVPTLGKVDPTCALATGCVTITSSTAGLTFSLDGGEYASYPSGGWCGLAAGSTHSVTVKNEAGCVSGPASITLASQPQSPAVPTLGKVDPTCALATGCVTITSSTAGLTFSLDGGEYASYPSGGWCGLAAGSTHSVTVKNEAGCVSGPASITLASQPQSPAVPTLGKVDPTCALATGCVTITSSTAGLTFSLDGGEYASYPSGGWCGLAAGSTHSVTVKNEAGCVSGPASITLGTATSCFTYCSYTQGFWGNKNGLKLMQSANLLATPIVIGRNGQSVTIPAGSEVHLNTMMPGGSTPTSLLSGNYTLSPGNPFKSAYLTKQGKINNNLLSQTITLTLNTRVNASLLGLSIQSGCLVTGKGSFEMNQNVVNYLTNNGAITATVEDLLRLANDILGGKNVLNQPRKPGVAGDNGRIVPSYSEVNSAVDAINNAFDGCSTFIGYQSCLLVKTTTLKAPESLAATSAIKVSAYPNPFTDVVKFTIESNVSGKAQLEIVNMMGQKIATVYNGYVKANHSQVVEYRMPSIARANLIYVLRINDKQATGKLLNARE